MDETALKILRSLVDEVIYSPTKSSARDPVARLDFMVSSIASDLEPYFYEKLNDVVIYAKEASGQASNKEHWISNVNQAWHIFENGVGH